MRLLKSSFRVKLSLTKDWKVYIYFISLAAVSCFGNYGCEISKQYYLVFIINISEASASAMLTDAYPTPYDVRMCL